MQLGAASPTAPRLLSSKRPGRFSIRAPPRLQPIENLIGPEPLEPLQRLVEPHELLARDAPDLLHGAHVLLVERGDDLADLAALLRELDAHRTAIDARALGSGDAHLDELLEIVGPVGAEIIAARAQFARGKLLVADVEQQQRLHRINVGATAAVELVLDDVEQPPMQSLDQGQGLEIERLNLFEARLTIGALRRVR